MTEHTDTEDPTIIGDGSAGREIYAYVYDHFGGQAFTRDETSDYGKVTDVQGWRWIRDFMQRLLAMDNLESAVNMRVAREREQFSRECSCGRDDDVLPPVLFPPRICWIWLEAAYERLGDAEGLCRLYSYRIVTNGLGPEMKTSEQAARIGAYHIGKLRKLSGDDWGGYVSQIVDLQQRYHSDPMFYGRNYAYEALLKQERMSDEAWKYCEARCLDRRDEEVIRDLFDVMVRGRVEEACELLLEPLHDADSAVLRSDTEKNTDRICSTLRLVAETAGPHSMRMEADRLRRMYRNRLGLRDALNRLLNEYGDETMADADGTGLTPGGAPRRADR